MRCISFVIFLTFSSCFLALPALENVTQADEIELLERKLEYLRAKKELDLELEIVKAKLQKLNQDYSDVIVAEPAASASSTSEAPETTSEAPETSEPAEPAKVEEAPTEVASSKGADREWMPTYAYCGKNKNTIEDITINEDGDFSLLSVYVPDPNLYVFIKGNLMRNEVERVPEKTKGITSRPSIKAEQDGEAWNIALKWSWGGGGCTVKAVIEPK